MGAVSENFDPSTAVSSGRERKCGTCKHFVVKPPEMELAKYALPIEACAPGVHCLGGAVRGTCAALGVMSESTNMGNKMPCHDKLYVPGGPSMLGAGSAARRGKPVVAPAASVEEGLNGSWLPVAAFVGFLAAKKIKTTFFGGK